MQLTQAARELHELRAQLALHIDVAKGEEALLRDEIRQRELLLSMSETGIDVEKVKLAKTIVEAGLYANGGDERGSCRADAIKQFATGKPLDGYRDLWRCFFGTKNYDRWHGQRCDCEYGMGPTHGSIVFRIGLTQIVRRDRPQSDLTPEEIESAIYYLVNLERVQAAESAARQKSAA